MVLAEKPLISEDTDLLEPTLLDELICHISSLASVYHKPPSAFVEGRTSARRFTLPARAEPTPSAQTEGPASPPVSQQATVIPSHPPAGGESLIGDLIGMDFGGGAQAAPPAAPVPVMSKCCDCGRLKAMSHEAMFSCHLQRNGVSSCLLQEKSPRVTWPLE